MMANAKGTCKKIDSRDTVKGTVWSIDLDGLSLSTFDEEKAKVFVEGKGFDVEYTEVTKGKYTNRYVNNVTPLAPTETVDLSAESPKKNSVDTVMTAKKFIDGTYPKDDRTQTLIVRQNALTNANKLLQTAVEGGCFDGPISPDGLFKQLRSWAGLLEENTLR